MNGSSGSAMAPAAPQADAGDDATPGRSAPRMGARSPVGSNRHHGRRIYSMVFVAEEGTASSLKGSREVIASHGLFCSLRRSRLALLDHHRGRQDRPGQSRAGGKGTRSARHRVDRRLLPRGTGRRSLPGFSTGKAFGGCGAMVLRCVRCTRVEKAQKQGVDFACGLRPDREYPQRLRLRRQIGRDPGKGSP